MISVSLLLALAPAVPQQTAAPRQGRPQAPYSLPPLSGDSRDGGPVARLVPEGAPAAAQVPAVHTDDSVPLPVPAEGRETPEGDVLDTPSSGDPFFLGFAGGRRYPAPGELVAQEVYDASQALGADGRPRAETYAFAMFSKRMTPGRLAILEQEGCRLLGFHPHYTQKVALPAAAIDRVAALDFVRWVGTPWSWQKVHPELAAVAPQQSLEVWINVFESDVHAGSRRLTVIANEQMDPAGNRVQGAPVEVRDAWITGGWQSRALEAQGIEVFEFAERVNAFRARIRGSQLDQVTALDFVQFVEPRRQATTHHDESMSMVNMDDVRNFYDGSTNQVAIAGIADSGVETEHEDLNWFSLGLNLSTSPNGTFQDDSGHGTHVAGTIGGDGSVEPGHTGAAPGIGFDASHPFFVARISSGSGTFSFDNVALISWLTTVQAPAVAIPHVINNSWGSDATGGYLGTEFDARIYDDAAYDFGQLNVFSAGNDGPNANTLTVQGSAKNVLTVGNVYDRPSGSNLPTTIASDSSRGPTGDGRWKPSVVAPGNRITSADAFDTDDYTNKSGTSMAAPHVTGLMAALVDRNNGAFEYLPERMIAQLMATATRKDNEVYSGPNEANLDIYGAGRVDGTSALWSGGNGTWTSWSLSLGFGFSTSGDFTVPSNATRLVAVMNYNEEAASAGASQALVNDFDLYLDQPPLSSGNNTGEWFNQQSSIDNTEIRVLDNPISGTWRWKVWPDSVTSQTFLGVTIYVETTDTTPVIAPTLTSSHVYAQVGEPVTFDYTLTTSGGQLSSVFLESTPTGTWTRHAARTTLADGIVTDLMNNWQGGADLVVGNVHPWFGRTAQWEYSWTSQGSQFFCVQARCENASNNGDIECIIVTVDGTPPPTPSPYSLAFFPNVWSSLTSGTMWWSTVVDTLSGLDGYSYSVTSAPQTPPQVINLPGAPIAQTISTPVSGTYWFNLAAVDKAGNWSPAASYGPILIDKTPPSATTTLGSSSHTAGVSSCDTTVALTWDPATDLHSGVAGYGVSFDQIQFSEAPMTVTTATAGYSQVLAEGSWYAHVRTIDNVGNFSGTVNFGPLIIDTTPVSTYCTSKVNSQGCTPTIGWIGSAPSASAGSGFFVTASNTLDNKNGLFFYGYAPKATQFQGGWLCVQAPAKRTPVQNSGGTSPCGGLFTYDFNARIASGIDPNLTAGTTVYGQYWSRDPQSSFNTNRTDAIQMTICP